MSFSLTGILKYLDSCPENEVMSAVAKQYEETSDTRNIFNDNFIPFSDLIPMGYAGVRIMLVSLYELRPSFIEENRRELYSITRTLKGE